MKNVAKCDTWCELQNPVNHRVFERKLRPKPPGRGHVCLGVTHRCPLLLRAEGRGRKLASRGRPARGWPKCRSSRTAVATFGGETLFALHRASVARAHPAQEDCSDPEAPRFY